MKLIKIKDNTAIRKDVLCDVENLTNKIVNKTLGQLEQEGSRLR